jgi:hypothetical protein
METNRKQRRDSFSYDRVKNGHKKNSARVCVLAVVNILGREPVDSQLIDEQPSRFRPQLCHCFVRQLERVSSQQ